MLVPDACNRWASASWPRRAPCPPGPCGRGGPTGPCAPLRFSATGCLESPSSTTPCPHGSRLAPRWGAGRGHHRQGGTITLDAPHKGIRPARHGPRGSGPDLGQPIKGQAALLAHDARDLPQIYADSLHVVPHGDGTTAIGSTTERDRTDTTTDDQIDAVIARARAIVPALADAPVIARWAGLRPARQAPADRWPAPAPPRTIHRQRRVKTGFGLAPLVGETMADLLLEARHDPRRIRPFRP